MNKRRIVVAVKYCKGELNPFDASALEAALLLQNADVTVISMSPKSVSDNLQGLTRLGAKAVLISDSSYAGSDTVATSVVLSKAIEKLDPDYVFCGRQSIDGDTSQVPPMISERLGFSFVSGVMGVDNDNLLLRDGEKKSLEKRTVVAFEKSYTLRFPSLFSKKSEVELWDNSVLNLQPNVCGIIGSTTRVMRSYESSVGRRFCQFVQMDKFEELILNPTKTEQKESTYNGEKLDKIYYVGKVKKVAESIAKESEELLVANKTVDQVVEIIKDKNVKDLLWEDKPDLKSLAARIAVKINAGLCADCIDFRVEDGKLIMTRPAYGGSITADIVSVGSVNMASVRTANKESKDLIFSVGMGAVLYIEKIRELAKKYDAEICCTRSVADSGAMPYSAQVGLTGKTVNPKVYVAFGVSGAVQHTCAISGSQTIIAINKDKTARIFDYADYGIIFDCENL